MLSTGAAAVLDVQARGACLRSQALERAGLVEVGCLFG
jgi:hypothetical protein